MITTRASGSASSGMSWVSASRPETMHASGSALQAALAPLLAGGLLA